MIIQSLCGLYSSSQIVWIVQSSHYVDCRVLVIMWIIEFQLLCGLYSLVIVDCRVLVIMWIVEFQSLCGLYSLVIVDCRVLVIMWIVQSNHYKIVEFQSLCGLYSLIIIRLQSSSTVVKSIYFENKLKIIATFLKPCFVWVCFFC